jgi:hypothetical protein
LDLPNDENAIKGDLHLMIDISAFFVTEVDRDKYLM